MSMQVNDEIPTAAEVLDGIDLTGRTALVTGGYSGIGVEIVRALAGAGAHVLAPARRPEKAARVLAGIDGVEVGELDLADQDSVAAYADQVLVTGRGLDLVVNSAGIMACPETRVGAGWELQLATNHLGHYALVNRLWPAIGAGARVVSVSSTGHHLSDFRWDDPWFEGGYDKWLAYGQSKTANVLFAVHLDALAREQGVRAFSLHPGAILTPLGRHLQADDLDAVMTLDDDGNPVLPDFRSPEQGAATAVWAATSPELDGRGGDYLEDCAIAEVVPDGPQTTSGVRSYALDRDAAERLWAWSAEVTGVNAF
jgi:NAD(P)-dependent dehydrogenase (short-subunit alcohol dehydrogenase family)